MSSTEQPGFTPAPHGPASGTLAGIIAWVQRVVQTVNGVLSGKLNSVLPITLTAGATSTTIIDPRIDAYSALLLTPLTADAANIAGTVYVSSQSNGTATLTHANSAELDMQFRLVIIG